MGEISNKTLALLVLAALAVVVLSTALQFNMMGSPTGMATTDTGTVDLAIGANLAIEVQAGVNNIDFGTCTPNASASYTINTNDTVDNYAGAGAAQCDGDTTSPQRIQVNNVGNVDANVTVVGECEVAEWLPETTGTTNDFQVSFLTTECGSGLLDAWTTLNGTPMDACANLTVANSINMSAQVTLDTDTQSTGNCGGDATNTITFNAYTIP